MKSHQKTGVPNEPFSQAARHTGMKTLVLIIHLTALATLFATFGQPTAQEAPAGVRRAIETVAKAGPVKSQIFKIAIVAR